MGVFFKNIFMYTCIHVFVTRDWTNYNKEFSGWVAHSLILTLLKL
jgi:nitrate reductase gamma subunit